jgi:hypothetical protein
MAGGDSDERDVWALMQPRGTRQSNQVRRGRRLR